MKVAGRSGSSRIFYFIFLLSTLLQLPLYCIAEEATWGLKSDSISDFSEIAEDDRLLLHYAETRIPILPVNCQIFVGGMSNAAIFSFPYSKVVQSVTYEDEMGVGSQPHWDTTCPQGLCEPSAYRKLKFKNQEDQKYLPGEKAYILPVFATDNETGELNLGRMIGFATYKVRHVQQKYIPKKHDRLNIRQWTPEGRDQGLVSPAVVTQQDAETGEEVKWIISESCVFDGVYSRDTLKMYGRLRTMSYLLGQYGTHAEVFGRMFGEGLVSRGGRIYGLNEPPTAYGLYEFERQIEFPWTASDYKDIAARFILPGVNTIDTIHECWTNDFSDYSCWGEVALGAVGDLAAIGTVVRLGKSAVWVSRATITGDAGFTGYYLINGDYAAAAGHALSIGPELVAKLIVSGPEGLGFAAKKTERIDECAPSGGRKQKTRVNTASEHELIDTLLSPSARRAKALKMPAEFLAGDKRAEATAWFLRELTDPDTEYADFLWNFRAQEFSKAMQIDVSRAVAGDIHRFSPGYIDGMAVEAGSEEFSDLVLGISKHFWCLHYEKQIIGTSPFLFDSNNYIRLTPTTPNRRRLMEIYQTLRFEELAHYYQRLKGIPSNRLYKAYSRNPTVSLDTETDWIGLFLSMGGQIDLLDRTGVFDPKSRAFLYRERPAFRRYLEEAGLLELVN